MAELNDKRQRTANNNVQFDTVRRLEEAAAELGSGIHRFEVRCRKLIINPEVEADLKRAEKEAMLNTNRKSDHCCTKPTWIDVYNYNM